MDDKEIKDNIKKRYGELAKANCSSCSSSSNSLSCCPSSNCESSPQYVAWKLGYSPDEIESIPENSVSGLGCGNPVALASLTEGQTVLDLGSCGGIDGVWSAKKGV